MIPPKSKSLVYPQNLIFSSKGLEKFAKELLSYSKAFFVGKILSESDTSWNNCFFHCLKAALVTEIIATEMNNKLDRKDMLDVESLKIAAFLHDSYKKVEVEKMKKNGHDKLIMYKTDEDSKNWLKKLGYGKKIVDLQEGFGNNAAKRIFENKIKRFDLRILHYVDDIIQDDQIVGLEKRLSSLEINPRYKEQNILSKKFFNGLTLYQAKRKINSATELKITQILELKSQNDLVPFINKNISAKILK